MVSHISVSEKHDVKPAFHPPRLSDEDVEVDTQATIEVIQNKFKCDNQIADRLLNPVPSIVVEPESHVCAEIAVKKSKLNPCQRIIVKDEELLYVEPETPEKPIIKLRINNQDILCLVDSGSDRSILKFEKLAHLEKSPEISNSSVRVRGLHSSSPVVGETPFTLRLPDKEVSVKALVLKNLKFKADILLGNDILFKTQAVIDYENKIVRLFNTDVPFCGDQYLKLGQLDQCFVADFRKNKKNRKKIKNNRVDVSKTQITGKNKEGNKIKSKLEENVHVMSTLIIPGNCMTTIPVYAKLEPGNYFVKKKVCPMVCL